jgi:two-component system chemotaxis response regulator CheY
MARVLVADDLDLIRTLCRSILERQGHIMIEATNGIEAIRRYKDFHPDAVILDVMMPGLDGLSALREIKKHDPTARVAVFTAHRERETVMRALELGVTDFVIKPFKSERLSEAVTKLLAS